eukprot:6971339-Prymnesium_polylepis.1
MRSWADGGLFVPLAWVVGHVGSDLQVIDSDFEIWRFCFRPPKSKTGCSVKEKEKRLFRISGHPNGAAAASTASS